MDKEVTVALITGISGLVGGLLIGYKDVIIGLLNKSEKRSSKRRLIKGLWSGHAFDVEAPPYITYKTHLKYQINFTFEQQGDDLTGTSRVSTPDRELELVVKGKFISDSYIFIEYSINSNQTVHLGAMIFTISELGDKMSGYYLAKRAIEEGIVFGRIELKRSTGI
jgi:hypothetical protein